MKAKVEMIAMQCSNVGDIIHMLTDSVQRPGVGAGPLRAVIAISEGVTLTQGDHVTSHRCKYEDGLWLYPATPHPKQKSTGHIRSRSQRGPKRNPPIDRLAGDALRGTQSASGL